MANRNTNAHFELAPQVEIERSTFQRDFNVKTAFNVGDLIPFYVDEVLPGDTFEIETSKVARLQTLIAPVMDNLYLDTYYFFVPNRLVWKHWKEFCGENNTSYWSQPNNYNIPQLSFPVTGWEIGTLADYMGLPVKSPNVATWQGVSVNALPFRAYCKIVNDWFRDENLEDPLAFYDDDTTLAGQNYFPDNNPHRCDTGSRPFKANKYHDYFTSCLPYPQKGPAVEFFDSSAFMPVHTFNSDVFGNKPVTNPQPMKMFRIDTNQPVGSSATLNVADTTGNVFAGSSTGSSQYPVYPVNLYADFGDVRKFGDSGVLQGNPMDINTLRQAFQVQRMLEKDARGGTRYIEILKTHFGVTSPDARLQRAEYLGGNRIPLNIEQVINTTGNQELQLVPGETSGWSQTNDVHFDVQKSFVEHGFVIGLMCARYDHSYQEGVERFWSRKTRYDLYWPALAHLGEQAVKKSEIACFGTVSFGQTFGYQEAWADYRYKPNKITGNMRTLANQSLDIWHFADSYSSEPYLSSSWIKEDFSNVNRALVVQGSDSVNGDRQIFIDILVKNKSTRPMPLYSIPGLIDHF